MVVTPLSGPLIASLYFSAGFAVFGAMVCLFVAMTRAPIRALKWLAAMCLGAAAIQISVASYHLASNNQAAALALQWHNILCSLNLLFLCGFLLAHSAQPGWRGKLGAIVALAGVMIVGSFTSPHEARFAGGYSLELMHFPWGETLQVSRGELSWANILGRALFLLPFLWLLARVVLPYRVRDGQSALLMGVGLLLLTASTVWSGVIEAGLVDSVFTSGYGFILFACVAAVLVVREVQAMQQRLVITAAALQQELDSHTRTQQEVERLSWSDTLTGLANRAGLLARLPRVLQRCLSESHPMALLLVDVDRFDLINDTLGPEVGDELLREIARRLQAVMHSDDFVARLHADEFVCVTTHALLADLGQLSEELHARLRLPIEIAGQHLHVTASIGMARAPEDGAEAEALLTAADLAMRDVKRLGGNGTQSYHRRFDEAIQERLLIGNALRVALEHDQFELYYQPQIDALDGRLLSFEALIRWKHPEQGLVAPLRFIPLAEEMHLINDIGRWVLDEACRQLATWRAAGLQEVRVSVNLSAQQLLQADLPAQVAATLARHGLRGTDLELEITESMVMKDPEMSIARLNELSGMGISLAMDDFGTGYSSLSYLQRLPIDTLKIDRSFVSEVDSNPSDAAICATTISMADTLGMVTVAEGVETERQAERLRELKCERFQGYLYARPMPPQDVIGFMLRFERERQAGLSA